MSVSKLFLVTGGGSTVEKYRPTKKNKYCHSSCYKTQHWLLKNKCLTLLQTQTWYANITWSKWCRFYLDEEVYEIWIGLELATERTEEQYFISLGRTCTHFTADTYQPLRYNMTTYLTPCAFPPVCTGMGDRVWVQFPVPDIYLSM